MTTGRLTSGRHWVAAARGGTESLRLVDFDVPRPGPGEVTIDVRAAGMNPADYKHLGRADSDDEQLIGYEVSGVLAAIGPDTEIASGGGVVGDEVLAFRTAGGYTTALTLAAVDVFAKPADLEHPAAANLLLTGTTAAEMLHLVGVHRGDSIVLHGASGAVGLSVLQQARLMGVDVVGTCGERRAETVRGFGGTPVAYGNGLESRLRELRPGGYAASLDAVGTDEAVDVSLAMIADRRHIVTIAAPGRAADEGFAAIAGSLPASASFRDAARGRLIELAARDELVVPVARTFGLEQALAALEELRGGHPGGAFALVP